MPLDVFSGRVVLDARGRESSRVAISSMSFCDPSAYPPPLPPSCGELLFVLNAAARTRAVRCFWSLSTAPRLRQVIFFHTIFFIPLRPTPIDRFFFTAADSCPNRHAFEKYMLVASPPRSHTHRRNHRLNKSVPNERLWVTCRRLSQYRRRRTACDGSPRSWRPSRRTRRPGLRRRDSREGM